LIGLGHDSGDLKFRRVQQGAQTGRGQFRRAHENDSQRHPLERNGKLSGKKAEKVKPKGTKETKQNRRSADCADGSGKK
jgi:hypothetical protein